MPQAQTESARPPALQPRDDLVALVSGIVLGTAAGLVGVGGGEFRIPVLLHLLRLEVKTAAAVNLIVGLFTVTLAFFRRSGQHAWPAEDLIVAGILVVTSICGSVVGARQAHRLSALFLRRSIYGYLIIIGVWMIVEAVTHTEVTLLNPQHVSRYVLVGLVGLVIAALSSSIGVAGGEMRIPALMYFFAYPVQQAGTISLLASIPTVGAGAFLYRRMGHLPNRALGIALLMGVGSLLGVFLGTAVLPFVSKHLLKGVLGAILLLATVCLALPGWRRPDRG